MEAVIVFPENAEQAETLKLFLASQQIPFEKDSEDLPDYVVKGIRKGQADIEAGRIVPWEEVKKQFSFSK